MDDCDIKSRQDPSCLHRAPLSVQRDLSKLCLGQFIYLCHNASNFLLQRPSPRSAKSCVSWSHAGPLLPTPNHLHCLSLPHTPCILSALWDWQASFPSLWALFFFITRSQFKYLLCKEPFSSYTNRCCPCFYTCTLLSTTSFAFVS